MTTKEVRRCSQSDGFFSQAGLGNFAFRWLHILFGITWIGLLYYFNFVQVPAFAAFGDEDPAARKIAIDKVARRGPVVVPVGGAQHVRHRAS